MKSNTSRLQRMLDREKEHLNWLIENGASMEFITRSIAYLMHYATRLEQYKKWEGHAETH